MIFPYAHIPKDKYQCNKNGELKIFVTRLVIPLSGSDIEEIEDKVRLVNKRLVGLRVDEPATSGLQMIDGSLSIPARNVFDSCYLRLRDDTDVNLENLSLRQIEKCNANGMPYHIQSGSVNLAESSLYVPNFANVQSNTAIVLIAEYVKPK